MLSLTDVSRHYQGTEWAAVDQVSLNVPQGEILALVGESGSGKTTLLRLIAGLEYPDNGRIEIGGEEVANADSGRWIAPEKRKVGFVFQDGALFPHMTVAANLEYGLVKRSRSQKAEILGRMLELTGLTDYRERYPHQLSGGERQRLAVARALAPEPKLILLDEPFSNLDPALRRKLRVEILDILQQAKATAIMVTHDTDDALAAGDRIAVFRGGKIEQEGTPSDVYSHPRTSYSAELFGPVNEIHVEGREPVWVRPEHMELCRSESNGDCICIPVRVAEVKDVGKNLEVIVESTGRKVSKQGRWLAIATRDFGCNEGDELCLEFQDKVG